jgi:hypothetical protein
MGYGHHLALLCLHFGRLPGQISEYEYTDYYNMLLKKSPSGSHMKHAVYSVRSYFRVMGKACPLSANPVIPKSRPCLTVLSVREVRLLLSAGSVLRDRVLLSLLYDTGMRRSELAFHPHLHCIVPAGGRDMKTGRWKSLPWVKDGKWTEAFLFPVRALSAMFKAKYMAAFTSKVRMAEDARQECFAQKWVVYAKEPACGVEQTLEYIARYAYRVAVSNRRIQEVTDNDVTFEWKDYKDGGKNKLMTLDGVEFLRRYAMHVLPRGFFRMRHYGILAPKNRDRLASMQQQIGAQPMDRKAGHRTWAALAEARGIVLGLCPDCGLAVVITVSNRPRVRSPDAGSPTAY